MARSRFFSIFSAGIGSQGGRARPLRALSCVCLSVLLVLCLGGKTYARVLVLNTFDIYPYSAPGGTGCLDRVVKEAFRRIGQKVKIVWLPSERALVNADRGIDDGDFVRVAGIEKKYHNLVRVPEKLCEFEFAAFAKTPVKITGWRSLKPYNVAIPRGAAILEKKVSQFRSLEEVNDQKALFSMVMNGRVDVIIYDRLQARGLMSRFGMKGIRQYGPVLEKCPMYLYMNRRYAALVPRLDKAIRQMKKDGAFRRIMCTSRKRSQPGAEKAARPAQNG